MKLTGSIVLALFFWAGSSGAAMLGPGDHGLSLEHGGRERVYRLHIPPDYDGKKAVPLVLLLHGGGGDSMSMVRSTKMDLIADREGFLTVYPEGISKQRLGKTFAVWNGGRCCGKAKEENVDDVGFISALIDRLTAEFRVDSDRVFVTGHSNGAIMTYRLACELSGKIAAAAPYGSVGDAKDCSPGKPLSILHLHGIDDSCSIYKGGECGGCWSQVLGFEIGDRHSCEPVPDHIARWQRLLGCGDKKARKTRDGPANCATFGGCREGVEVTLCGVEGLGHAWPGRRPEDTLPICSKRPDGFLCRRIKKVLGPYRPDYPASERIWAFFKAHPRSRGGHGPE